ncbi:MAG: xanthine dehydrogenase family protein subunit M [Acidobacteria bacterium]|nr:xanthine dehydrogenase family protein subunit M [Acidobacteriota bacterium]
MYASSFAYHRASSVADAQRLLAANPGAKILAGGHSLLPAMKLRLSAPGAVVDIGRIAELKGITAADGGLRIGAMTTHAEVAASPLVAKSCAILADAASRIGDPAVRNRGTIGGSVAHADPAADLPTVLTAVGARMEIAGASGTRSVEAAEFFQGMMTTALGESDILTAVWVPAIGGGRGAAYAKFPHPASRYAVIGAAAAVDVSGGACTRAIIVVGGITGMPTRLPSVEAALAGQALTDEAVASACSKAAGDLSGDLMGDIFASAEYRRAVAGVYVARAVAAAAKRAS